MISIVLPVYNREVFLAECIESIINQTYKDWELIIVDDGSTDSSPDLIKYYKNKDKRIVDIKGVHNGISVARNAGIQASTGDYIAVMDSDDIMHPERLKKAYKGLQKVDFVYAPYLMGDLNLKVYENGLVMPAKKMTFEDIKNNRAYPHVTIVAKRKCFEENPYRDDFKVNDDAWLVYKWFVAGYTNKRINEPSVIQRGHVGNTSRSKRDAIEKTQKIMDREYKQWE